MRILIVSEWFDPEPFYKGLPLARGLINLGHEVEVLTGFPNYPGGQIYDGYRVRPWQRETLDGVPVTRVSLYPSHDNSGARRVATYLSFGLSASVLGGLLTKTPDVIYAYHPPGTVGLAASCLRFAKRAPLVYDVQDMWPDTLAATGMFTSQFGLKLVGAAMSAVYRVASRIVVLSPGFKRLLVERGVPERKIRVVYNWSPDEGSRLGGDDVVTRTPAPADPFTVLFAGNMGHAQGLSSVLDAAALLSVRAPKVRFVFIGSGVDKHRLQERTRELRLSNVEFRDAVARDNIAAVLQSADALLVHLRDDPLFSVTIPSKTQSYLMAGRPIIMGVRGDAARVVLEAGAGIVCEPQDPESIAAAVLRMSETDVAARQEMGARGRRFYWEHLSFQRGVLEIENVLRESAQG